VDRLAAFALNVDLATGLFSRIALTAAGALGGCWLGARLLGLTGEADAVDVAWDDVGLATGALAVAVLAFFVGVGPTLPGVTTGGLAATWSIAVIPYAMALAGLATRSTTITPADESPGPEPSRDDGGEAPAPTRSETTSSYSLEAKASMLKRQLVDGLRGKPDDGEALLDQLDELERLADDAEEQGQHAIARRINRFLDRTRVDLAEVFLDEGTSLYESAKKARRRGARSEFRSFLERADTKLRRGRSLVDPIEGGDVYEDLTEARDLVSTLLEGDLETESPQELKERVEHLLEKAESSLREAQQAREASQEDRAARQIDRAEQAAERAESWAKAALELAADGEDKALEHELKRYVSEAERLARQADHASMGHEVTVKESETDDVRQAILATGKVDELEREFASGGFGRTFLVRDELGRRVVVKTLKENWNSNDRIRNSFRNEAALESERHENLVHVDAYFEKNGFPLKFMEFVEGGSIDQLLDSAGRIPPDRALGLIEDTVQALAWVNQDEPVVHRDIKPANILLADDGTAKLTDFGLAKVDREDPEASLARQDQQPGTLKYMSPEQATGSAAITASSDMFSLGIVLYEMVTGEHPFLSGTDAREHEIRQRLAEEPPALGHEAIPPTVRELLRRLLAKDPEERFPDHEALLEAIRETRDELEERSTGPPSRRFDGLSRYVDDPDRLEPQQDEDVSFLISQLPEASGEEKEEVARDLDDIVHEWIHEDGDEGLSAERAEHVAEEYADLLGEACEEQDAEEALLVAEKLLTVLQGHAPDGVRDFQDDVIQPLDLAVEEDDPGLVDWSRIRVAARRARDALTATGQDRQAGGAARQEEIDTG
jgi:serine/threonine protein kinase